MSTQSRVLILGGGTAGISVAARLRAAGREVTVVEPSLTHDYQPLWTLVGGGRAPLSETRRAESSVMPKGVTWVRDRAETVDPAAQTVGTAGGQVLSYDQLVVCPGIQLDWGKVPGLGDALETPSVASNYTYELAPKTWGLIQGLRRGTAVFTMPAGPIKCAGAPQKIAYLAADYWRQQGVLKDIRVVLVLPTPGMFGVKEFADVLETVVARYGIEVYKSSELVEVDARARSAIIADNVAGTKQSIDYDLMHVVPPQSAPDWIKQSPLADAANPAGYVEIDKNTMQHVRHPNVFALGDAGSSPNSKTGAAIRKQAPVVVKNLQAVASGAAPTAQYDGYASCPLTTARNKMLLAEFDYTMKPAPSFPPRLLNAQKERTDMWYLKRYGLPFLYWNLMLKGRA
ncbi:MAG: FAD/NAD(P)-binding oxidoreductase [Mycobacteriales bacterium]